MRWDWIFLDSTERRKPNKQTAGQRIYKIFRNAKNMSGEKLFSISNKSENLEGSKYKN